MNRGLFETAKPLVSENVEPYRHVTSSPVMTLALQTQALRQNSRNATTVLFPSPSKAPYSTLTSLSISQRVKHNGVRDLSIYHMIQKGHDTLVFDLIFAIRGQLLPYVVNASYVGAGVSLTDTGEFRLGRPFAPPMNWLPSGDVNDGSYSFSFARCQFAEKPSIPTDRLFRILFDVKKSEALGEPAGAASQTDYVYLYSALIYSRVSGPETE